MRYAGIILLSIIIVLFSCRKEDNGSPLDGDHDTIIIPDDTPENMVKDIDGNLYKTVILGGRTWMREDLKVTHFNNGDDIPTTDPADLDISHENHPKYQWIYDSVTGNASLYGRLYTWYVVEDSRELCPSGWHVPSDGEWTDMSNILGGENIAGGKLKSEDTLLWIDPNMGATNESGFDAQPGGRRHDHGSFGGKGVVIHFWTSTEENSNNAWFRDLVTDYPVIFRGSTEKSNGHYVRCIKD